MKTQIPNSSNLLLFRESYIRSTEPMGIHHSPHTHTIPIPMGIPMGIPIPTAALGGADEDCE